RKSIERPPVPCVLPPNPDRFPELFLRQIVPWALRRRVPHGSKSPAAHIPPQDLRTPERRWDRLRWLLGSTGFLDGDHWPFFCPSVIFPSSKGDRRRHFRYSVSAAAFSFPE